jgi:hypothetical protein
MANSNGSFVRWQGIAITQMGYAVNLILSFTTASLGFALALFKDVKPQDWGRWLLVLAGVLLMASIAIGAWCVLNRLTDFRESAQIAHDRERWHNKGYAKTWINDRLRCRRSRNRRRGKLTNRLFNWQVGTFGVGAALLVLAVVAVYGGDSL